jgi:hypothetical protein
VYFRISEEEFLVILKACEARGARSVSDLARSAVQEFIKPPKSESEQQILDMMSTLRTLLEDVASTVKQLASASPAAATPLATGTATDEPPAASSSVAGQNS